jgi:hypothetical protein
MFSGFSDRLGNMPSASPLYSEDVFPWIGRGGEVGRTDVYAEGIYAIVKYV